MKNVSNKCCRENKNTLFVCSNCFENSAVNEIMWKNILECGGTQMTIWGMCIACWIPEATNTHSNIYWFSNATMVA